MTRTFEDNIIFRENGNCIMTTGTLLPSSKSQTQIFVPIFPIYLQTPYIFPHV